MDSLSPFNTKPITSSLPTFQQSVIEVSPEVFGTEFKTGFYFDSDEPILFKGAEALRTAAIGDCITVFSCEEGRNNVPLISGFHMLSETTEDDILEEFISDLNSSTAKIYIIGGDDNTTAPGALLDRLRRTAGSCLPAVASLDRAPS